VHWWDVRNKVNVGELMPTCQVTAKAVIDMVHVRMRMAVERASRPLVILVINDIIDYYN
jgi:hypothetical protein